MTPRGFFPPNDDASLWSKPLSLSEKALIWVCLLGPLVVGIGAPLLVRALGTTGNDLGIVLAVFTLPFGLYMLAFAALLGGLGPSRRNPLEDVPVGDMAQRRDGDLVMVSGRAEAGPEGTVLGELTGKRWLWSELKLTTYEPGSRGPTVDVFRTRSSAVRFTVDDGHERVWVDPRGGLLRAAPHQTEARLPGPGAPRVRALLEQEGLSEPRAGADASEWSLAEGDVISVLGVVRRGDAYRDAACLGSGPEDQLVVTGETRAQLVAPHRPPRGLALGGIIVTFGAVSAVVWAMLS